MKLIRNHLLDKGFCFLGDDGEYHSIDKKDFLNLLQQDQGVYRLCPKLTQQHVEVTGSQRQIVRLATQLLSDTVAKALKFVGNGKMDVQAEGLLTCNNWLDVMNSRDAYTNNPYTNGFGINKQIHFQNFQLERKN